MFQRAVLRLVDRKAKTKAQNSSYVPEIVLFRIPTVKLKIPGKAWVKNYNLNVREVRDSDFKNAFHGIFNFTVGILVLFWGRLSKLYQRVKSVIQEEVPSMEYNTVVQAEEKVPVNEEALYQHQQVTAAAESVSVSSTQQVAPKPKKTVQINESRDSQSEEIRRLEQELRDARKQIEILSR